MLNLLYLDVKHTSVHLLTRSRRKKKKLLLISFQWLFLWEQSICQMHTVRNMEVFLELRHLHSVEDNSCMLSVKIVLEREHLISQVPVKTPKASDILHQWRDSRSNCGRITFSPLKFFDTSINIGDQSPHTVLRTELTTCNAHVLQAGSLLTYSNEIVRHLTYKHTCKSHFACANFCTFNSHKNFICKGAQDVNVYNLKRNYLLHPNVTTSFHQWSLM